MNFEHSQSNGSTTGRLTRGTEDLRLQNLDGNALFDENICLFRRQGDFVFFEKCSRTQNPAYHSRRNVALIIMRPDPQIFDTIDHIIRIDITAANPATHIETDEKEKKLNHAMLRVLYSV